MIPEAYTLTLGTLYQRFLLQHPHVAHSMKPNRLQQCELERLSAEST